MSRGEQEKGVLGVLWPWVGARRESVELQESL